MVAVTMTAHGVWTLAERDALPEDGRRHELLDGALIVTPAPSWAHQTVVLRLGSLLMGACPEGLAVLVAPFDVVLADDTVLRPDLLVARVEDLTQRNLPAAPVLAVEVLSPSTRLIDLNLKHARYQVAEVGSYWVVDPATGHLWVWELRDGAFVLAADIAGDVAYQATHPFPVTLPPHSRAGR